MRGLTTIVLSGLLAWSVPAATAAEGPPSPTAERSAALPDQVRGGVEVDLPEGDRFRVWHSTDLRTVWGRRYDAATGSWGDRTVVLRERDLYCGDVDARSAGGAVAVMAECDRGGWSEDQAPVSSHAVYSPDALTWSARELEGEAYEEPGISPSGAYAVWPEGDGYLAWSPGTGFAAQRLATPGQEYTETAVVTDSGQVSVVYGAPADATHTDCVLRVRTRLPDGSVARQDLDVEDACSDVALANVDSRTVSLGDPALPAYVTVIGRPDDASPWAVTAVAPAGAPGLRTYRGRRSFGQEFVAADGLPLVAVGSDDGRAIWAQAYDAVAQRWSSAVHVDTAPRRCEGGDNWHEEPLSVTVVQLRCRGGARVVATTDGRTWHALPLGRHPLGVSEDERFVAVPGNRATTVLSRELGAVRLAGGATGRCDVVVPDGPDAAVRLTSTRTSNGWPRVLQRSTARGWARSRLVRFPDVGTCRRARAEPYEVRRLYSVSGGGHGYWVRVVRRGGRWEVRRTHP